MQEGFATATDWFAIALQETGERHRVGEEGGRQLSAFGCKIKEWLIFQRFDEW